MNGMTVALTPCGIGMTTVDLDLGGEPAAPGAVTPRARGVPVRVLVGVTLAGSALLAAFLLRPLLDALAERWSQHSYYSRAFLVPLFSAYLAWDCREKLRLARPAWSRPGVLLCAGSLAVLGAGTAIASLVVTALAVPLGVGGLAVLVLGRERARAVAFPIAFLSLATPLPPALIPTLSLALRNAAALATHATLGLAGIESARAGTSIVLRGVTVDINDTCNGLSFLMAMLVIGVAFAWLNQSTWRRRLGVIALAGVVGLVGNWIRILGTALIAHRWGPAAATGVLHSVYGEAVYLGMVALFIAVLVTPSPRSRRFRTFVTGS
jgi:exosortase